MAIRGAHQALGDLIWLMEFRLDAVLLGSRPSDAVVCYEKRLQGGA
jgi:hypothetical protein